VEQKVLFFLFFFQSNFFFITSKYLEALENKNKKFEASDELTRPEVILYCSSIIVKLQNLIQI